MYQKVYIRPSVYETHLGRVLRPLDGKLIYPTTEDWDYKSKIFYCHFQYLLNLNQITVQWAPSSSSVRSHLFNCWRFPYCAKKSTQTCYKRKRHELLRKEEAKSSELEATPKHFSGIFCGVAGLLSSLDFYYQIGTDL